MKPSETPIQQSVLTKLREVGAKNPRWDGKEIVAGCPNPAHRDSSPSFFYEPTTGRFYCHGCKLKGRGIENLYRQLGYSYSGINPIWEAGVFEPEPDRPVVRYIDPSVIEALPEKFDYLEGRGVSREAQRRWGVKYSPEDKRYIVPARFRDGLLVGYVGIADDELRAKGAKKVLYSVGLPGKWLLLGSDLVPAGEYLVLVEGPVDAMRLSGFGEEHVVSLLGSGLSEGQKQGILALNPRALFLMLDRDQAGYEAAVKIYNWGISKRIPTWEVDYCGGDPGDATPESLVLAVSEMERIYRNLRGM